MMRKILSGAFAVAALAAVGFLPTSCQSGGIGDPCTPEDEYNPLFGGFKVTEDNIESRSFQCQSRICLVNHFQGRVTCPLGQPAPVACKGTDDTSCADGGACVEGAVFAPFCCTGKDACGGTEDVACTAGFTCQNDGHFCSCDPANDSCPADQGYKCVVDPNTGLGQCKSFVCHTAGDCQTANASASGSGGGSSTGTNPANLRADGTPKGCCAPGTDTPVATAVCGQCDESGGRNADKAVYCSCRCGEPLNADGSEQPRDPNFNYCDCPDGFECKEIRKNIGISDPQLAGQYCVKKDTATSVGEAGAKCGSVKGFFSSGANGTVGCAGTPSAAGP